MSNDNDSTPEKGGGHEFESEPTLGDLSFRDDEKTRNLLRRLEERNAMTTDMPAAHRIDLTQEATDWRQIASDIAAQLTQSRTYRALVSGLGATSDRLFGIGRWLAQASERRESLLKGAAVATARVENAWNRFQRSLGGRVEAVRFVRDPVSLTYDIERVFTDLIAVAAHIPSYGMATIAIRRFGKVRVIMRGVNLAKHGLQVRLTRRKGLTLLRLHDEAGDTLLLTATMALLLLSQYEDGRVSLNELVIKFEDRRKKVAGQVYQPSPHLAALVRGDWEALRERGILKSGRDA